MTTPGLNAEVERQLDQEIGSAFDWLTFPTELFLEKDTVTDWPDRGWVRDVEEMLERDGQAQGVLSALTLPLRQANLTLMKPDKDKGQTERIRTELFSSATDGGMDTPIGTIISQMTQAAAFRRTYHERVFTRRPDGFVGYKKLAWRPAASCEMVRDRKTGELLGFKQFADIDRRDVKPDWRGFLEIPQVRTCVHINGQHRDPLYGFSDLAVTNWAYTMKQKVWKLWLVFLDRQSLPKTIAYGRNGPEATSNARSLASIRASGVVGMIRGEPNERPFDVLDTAGQGAAQFQECMRYLDQCMSSSVLAGWMDLTGSAASGHGSYALSADQSGLFLASRHGAAKEIADTWNTQIIAPLVHLNYGPDAAVPQLVFEKISQEQTDRSLALLQALSVAPTLQVPSEFIWLLIERVAQYLDLPDDRVEKIVRDAAKKAREAAATAGAPVPAAGSPAGNLSDAVNGALAAVTPPPAAGPAPAQPGAPVA